MNEIIKKHLNNKLIIVLAIFGIVLILASTFNKNIKTDTSSDISEQEYILNLEARIESIISTIDGVGNCDVMLNIKSTGESIYVKENKESYDSGGETKKGESENKIITMTDREGNQHALVTKKNMPEISGVIVVCDGGDNPKTQSLVISAVCTLLGIGSNNVCVIQKS